MKKTYTKKDILKLISETIIEKQNNHKTKEIYDEIEMRMRPTDNKLPYDEINEIAEEYGVDIEEVAQIMFNYVSERDLIKEKELKDAIEHILEHDFQGETPDFKTFYKRFLDYDESLDYGIDNIEPVKKAFDALTKDSTQLSMDLHELVSGDKLKQLGDKFKEQKLRAELGKIGPEYAMTLRELYDLAGKENYLTALKNFVELHNKALEKTQEPKKEIENPKMFTECACEEETGTAAPVLTRTFGGIGENINENENDITNDLQNFDLDNLDIFEKRQFEHAIKSMSKEDALQVLINNVEGDFSQLSPELAALAEKQNRDYNIEF